MTSFKLDNLLDNGRDDDDDEAVVVVVVVVESLDSSDVASFGRCRCCCRRRPIHRWTRWGVTVRMVDWIRRGTQRQRPPVVEGGRGVSCLLVVVNEGTW